MRFGANYSSMWGLPTCQEVFCCPYFTPWPAERGCWHRADDRLAGFANMWGRRAANWLKLNQFLVYWSTVAIFAAIGRDWRGSLRLGCGVAVPLEVHWSPRVRIVIALNGEASSRQVCSRNQATCVTRIVRKDIANIIRNLLFTKIIISSTAIIFRKATTICHISLLN